MLLNKCQWQTQDLHLEGSLWWQYEGQIEEGRDESERAEYHHISVKDKKSQSMAVRVEKKGEDASEM